MVKNTTKKAASSADVPDDKSWHATPEAKSRAKNLRIIALVLWALSIATEIGGIFGILLNKKILSESTSVNDKGELVADQAFPNWAFFTLIALLVVIAILTIVGSQLWKKAQELDPPSQANGISFFFKSQLGAIIPLIAFVPIIVLIFLNKDMSKQQKGWAGGVGVVLALVAVALGVNWNPPSQEKYTADKMAVVQLLGEDKVYWAGSGSVYHVCGTVSDLSKSQVSSGTTAEAVEAGLPRLTLKLQSELEKCGRAVPNNIDQIVASIRDVQQGKSETQILPTPDWTGVANAPQGEALDELNDALKDATDGSSD